MSIQAIMQISPDLDKYSLLLVLGASANKGGEKMQTVTNTKNCRTGETDTETEDNNRDLSYGFAIDSARISDLPLPSTRSTLTGSKTVPIRFYIGKFVGDLDATVQWTLTPLGK